MQHSVEFHKELDSVRSPLLVPSLGDRVISGSVLALSHHLELLFLTGTSDLFLEPSGNTDIDGRVFSAVF